MHFIVHTEFNRLGHNQQAPRKEPREHVWTKHNNISPLHGKIGEVCDFRCFYRTLCPHREDFKHKFPVSYLRRSCPNMYAFSAYKSFERSLCNLPCDRFIVYSRQAMPQAHLCHSFHWLLFVHLKDTILCCARHSQLMPLSQTDRFFAPVLRGRKLSSILHFCLSLYLQILSWC